MSGVVEEATREIEFVGSNPTSRVAHDFMQKMCDLPMIKKIVTYF
jgi:hypothetical protein